MGDTVTELQQAYNPPGQVPATSAGSSEATKTPLGSTKGNFFGKEAEPLKKRGEINAELGAAVKEEGENKIARAVGDMDQATEVAQQGGVDLSELTALKDAHNAEVQKLVAKNQPIIDAADKFKFHDHWSEPHVGQSILAAISSGLLGFGTGQYHNVAKEIADADHARQATEFNALLERSKAAGANMEQLLKIQEHGTNTLSLMQAAKYKAIAAKYQQMGAAATTVEQQNEARKGYAMFMKLANDETITYYQGLRTSAAKNVSKSMAKPQGGKPAL